MNIKRLKQIINKEKYQKILIISGKNSYYKSKADKFFKKILMNKKIFFFFKRKMLPEYVELKKIINFSRISQPDLIIAIGGGAVIDYAKIANFAASKNITNLEKKIIYSKKISDKNYCDLIAIPTTSGSGAEVTSNAVIYINGKKYSVEHKFLKPKFFFLIPEFIISNPFNLRATSGFDAFAQSIESLLSLKSNKNSIEFAIKSLKIINQNYSIFLKTKKLNICNKMLIAANLSGKAINISKTTAPHAVSYPFSSIYGLSHGHAVSLNFEKFLKFNFMHRNELKKKFNLNRRFEIIFKIMKVKNINELCKKITKMKTKAKLIDDMKLLKINVGKNIQNILNKINLKRLKNNPIKLNNKILKKIILENKNNFLN